MLPSDTDPLLIPSKQTFAHEDRFKDRPIRLKQFRRNVLICKIFLGVSLAFYLALEVYHAARSGLDGYSGAGVLVTVSTLRIPLKGFPYRFLPPLHRQTNQSIWPIRRGHTEPISSRGLYRLHLLRQPPPHPRQPSPSNLLCLVPLRDPAYTLCNRYPKALRRYCRLACVWIDTEGASAAIQ